jgi:hypothetical protein
MTSTTVGCRRLTGRRPLDTAEGVLIGLRHCTPKEAFEELVAAANRYGLPVFSLASALIDIAAGESAGQADNAAAVAVHAEWDPIIGRCRADGATR